MSDNVDLVRRGWEAALSGEFETVAALLADDVRWHAAGDEDGGCQNRAQSMQWMRAAIQRGAGAQVREVRALDDERVLVAIQRPGAPEPHAQVVTVRDGKIVEMVVHPTMSLAGG